MPLRIFVAHASSFNYTQELYLPLRNSELNKIYNIFLPLEKNTYEAFTADFIKDFDLVVAEVSYPSTGQGIELGWANIFNIPIVCIYKKGTHPSLALDKMTRAFLEYTTPEDMVKKLADAIKK